MFASAEGPRAVGGPPGMARAHECTWRSSARQPASSAGNTAMRGSPRTDSTAPAQSPTAPRGLPHCSPAPPKGRLTPAHGALCVLASRRQLCAMLSYAPAQHCLCTAVPRLCSRTSQVRGRMTHPRPPAAAPTCISDCVGDLQYWTYPHARTPAHSPASCRRDRHTAHIQLLISVAENVEARFSHRRIRQHLLDATSSLGVVTKLCNFN